MAVNRVGGNSGYDIDQLKSESVKSNTEQINTSEPAAATASVSTPTQQPARPVGKRQSMNSNMPRISWKRD